MQTKGYVRTLHVVDGLKYIRSQRPSSQKNTKQKKHQNRAKFC